MDMSVVYKILLVGGLAIVGIASRFLFKMKPDNQIEEVAEAVIKARTGVDIDLSPDTPDKEVEGQAIIREGMDFLKERNIQKPLNRGEKVAKI